MTESEDCPEGLASSSYYSFYMIEWTERASESSEDEVEADDGLWYVEKIADY
jgi:hypothetical protein